MIAFLTKFAFNNFLEKIRHIQRKMTSSLGLQDKKQWYVPVILPYCPVFNIVQIG